MSARVDLGIRSLEATHITALGALVASISLAGRPEASGFLLFRVEALPERWLRLVGLELLVLYYPFWGPRLHPARTKDAFNPDLALCRLPGRAAPAPSEPALDR